MGAVYFAEDTRTGQRAAVKVLTAASPCARARFIREQRLLVALDHRAIPRLLTSGTLQDGRPYFAMDYVPGTQVTDLARAHALGVTARIELFGQVCDAVRHVHTRLVVHRDIKPSNVLASGSAADGYRVHLLDFGAASSLTDLNHGALRGGTVTAHGLRPMTPAYAAPEQSLPVWAGREAETTTATDVFALGALLYELLTGSRPADGGAPPSRLVDLGLGHCRSWAVDAVIERCIDPAPAKRYGSAVALYADVESVLEGRLPVGVQAGRLRRVWWFAAHYGAALAVLAVCVVALVIAVAFA